MNVNISHIEAFIYVYHLSGFNKAAEALYLTQPTISARIQTLEKDMNIILFNRDRKGITLTDEGKAFLPFAYRIFNAYKEAKINMGQELKEMNLGSITSVSTSLLPKILSTFKEQYPAVSVNIFTGPTGDILTKIVNKQCHFGITEAISDSRIHNLPFHTDPYSLVVPRNHPLLSIDREVTMKDIAFEPFITISQGVLDKRVVEEIFAKQKLKPHIVFEVDNIETAKFMVLKGMGISFLPKLCFENEQSTGELFTIPIVPLINIKREIDIIYLKGTKPPFLNAFV